MPKRREKKVLVKGICTWPPLAKEANNRSVTTSSGTASNREKPSDPDFPSHRPSEAINVVSPMWKLAWAKAEIVAAPTFLPSGCNERSYSNRSPHAGGMTERSGGQPPAASGGSERQRFARLTCLPQGVQVGQELPFSALRMRLQ
jgi:hypothetical protein